MRQLSAPPRWFLFSLSRVPSCYSKLWVESRRPWWNGLANSQAKGFSIKNDYEEKKKLDVELKMEMKMAMETKMDFENWAEWNSRYFLANSIEIES